MIAVWLPFVGIALVEQADRMAAAKTEAEALVSQYKGELEGKHTPVSQSTHKPQEYKTQNIAQPRRADHPFYR